MGAYENPAANVDTESGKMWANAISSVGQNTVVAMEKVQARQAAIDKENKENAEKNKAITDRVLEEESKLNTNIYSTESSTNNGIDYHTAFAPQIDEYSRLRTSILNGTSPDPINDRKKADRIYASVSVLKSGIEDLTTVSSKWKEAYLKKGGGSVDLSLSDPNMIKAFNVLENKLKGWSAKFVFTNGDPSRPAYAFNDGKGDSFTLELSALTKALDGGQDAGITIVPSSTENITNIQKSSVASDTSNGVFVYNEKGVYTGRVAAQYEIGGREIVKKNTQGGTYVGYEYTIDKEAILKNEEIIAECQRQVAGMTDSKQFASFYNNYMLPMINSTSSEYKALSENLKLEKIVLDGKGMPSAEDRVKFESNLRKIMVNSMSNTQMSDDPAKFIANKKVNETKLGKPTSLDILSSNIEDPGNLTRIDGGKNSGGRYAEKQPNDKWILFDKDGIQVGAEQDNPSAFSGELGIK